jgi:hypothetical protein
MRLLDLGYPVPEEFVCQPGELTTIDWLEKHIQEKTHGRFQISKIRFRIEKSEKAEQVAGSFTYHSLEPGMGYHAAEAGSSGAAADRLDSESNPSVIHDHFIPYLERNLRQHGPVILSITDPKIEGHWIIVDEVSQADGTVRIRDPYHGRMIDVGIEAFMKRFIQDDSEKNLPEKMLWVKKPAHGGAGGSGLF